MSLFQATRTLHAILFPQTSVDLTIFFLNYIIYLCGKPHKSRFGISVPAYCHDTSLLIADLIIKITMFTQEQELKKFLEMLAGMRPKFVKFPFTGYNALESWIIIQIIFK